MIVQKFRIEADGRPVRLYINSRTKLRCAEIEDVNYASFSSQDDAEKKATLYELALLDLGSVVIAPFQRDIGTPTRLTEIGL